MEIAGAHPMNRTPILFAHWGEEGIRGSERVLLDLLADLDRDRYEPVLWCNAESLADAARSLKVATEVSRMPILLGWDSPRLDLGAYGGLVRRGQDLIRRHGIRLVHANSGAPNQWMVPAARRARVPLVAHLHAVYGSRERCTLLLHQAPIVVGCSRAVVRPFRLDGIPEARLRVIHNGVNLARLNSGDAKGLRKTLGVGPDSVLVVGAGALIPLKGFDVLLRAFEIARRRGLDAHFAIAGEGPERGRLDSLAGELGISDHVHFLGQQENLGAILRDAADIVVIGSNIEAFGLVAAEAGAMGRPTIGTRVGGVPELVEEGKTGLLVQPGDHAALANALIRLGHDPDLRHRLGSAARSHVLARLTTERVARSFEGLYATLLAQPAEAFGWTRLGFRIAPFARLGLAVVGRRLGMSSADA